MVARTLKEALKDDKARTNVLPISELGLLEMTRQRAEVSIRDTTYMDCPYCKARGKVKSALSMSVEIQRHIAEVMRKHKFDQNARTLRITVNPKVLERLKSEDEAELIAIQKKYKGMLKFLGSEKMHLEEFTISQDDPKEDLYSNVER